MYKYYMFDRGILVAFRMTNAAIEVNKLQKDVENNPLFTEDFFANPPRKWEVRYDNAYPNVIYDPKYQVYRCYYTLFTYDESAAGTPLAERGNATYQPKGNRITSLGYAESKDGIHWEKPSLGLVEFEGSTDNNLLMLYAHGTGVFLDMQETDPAKRYKLVTKVEYNESRLYMAVAFSEDGIHFSDLIEWPKYNPAGDSHNFPFRDPNTGKFVVLTRIWKNGVRICAKCESDDFISWSEPVEVLRGQGYEDEVYSMPAFDVGGVTLGLASMYHNGDTDAPNFDTVDLELMYSTRLDAWDRIAPGQYFIERGQGKYPNGEFDCGCIYAAVPLEIDGKLCFYYMGGNGQHTNFRETSFGRGFLEKDKYAGYVQKDSTKPALLTTSHFCIFGENISILADIPDDGNVQIAIGTKSGKVYEGFEAENCVLEKQEDGYYKISFKNHSIMELRTKPISFHIHFQNAKIYAIKGDLESHKMKY